MTQHPGQKSVIGLLGRAGLVLLLTMSTSQAVVLCIGCDGHVAVEAAGHEHGDHAPSDDVHRAVHRGIPPQHCQSCVDVPITAGALNAGIAGARWQTTDIVSPAHVWICQIETCDPLTSRPARPPVPPPRADPLRSIVLQI